MGTTNFFVRIETHHELSRKEIMEALMLGLEKKYDVKIVNKKELNVSEKR